MKRDDSKNESSISCYICRQPVDDQNRFTVSWNNNGEIQYRIFCGSSCLKLWANNYSENIKLELYDP